MLLIDPQGPGHLRQGRQQAAIDGGQAFQEFGVFAGCQRQGLLGQFADDGLQRFGVEMRGAASSEPKETRDSRVCSGPLSRQLACCKARRLVRTGLKKNKQDERGVLIEEELAIAGAIVSVPTSWRGTKGVEGA